MKEIKGNKDNPKGNNGSSTQKHLPKKFLNKLSLIISKKCKLIKNIKDVDVINQY